jgi:hypothetical protein
MPIGSPSGGACDIREVAAEAVMAGIPSRPVG